MSLARILVIGAAFFGAPSVAQDALPGVRFDLMPVGCKIYASYSTGQDVIDEYLGQKDGRHLMRTYDGPTGTRVVRDTLYDSSGFMIRKDWSKGLWETFSPFSCFGQPGPCQYVYRNADGADLQYSGDVTRKGEDVVITGGFEGELPFPDMTLHPGPFNLGDEWNDGFISFRVTRYENCGIIQPSS